MKTKYKVTKEYKDDDGYVEKVIGEGYDDDDIIFLEETMANCMRTYGLDGSDIEDIERPPNNKLFATLKKNNARWDITVEKVEGGN